MNADDFFSPSTSDVKEPSRPRAVNPKTGKEQSWTRPSSHANVLDNPHGLVITRGRKVIEGLSRAPHLARAVMSGAALDDKSKADEIIASALEAADDKVKALAGTAGHAALSRSWLGHAVPEEFHPLIAAFAKGLRDNGLTPVMTETCVLNCTHNTKGTFDWVFAEADGQHVIGDVKFGRIDVAKRKFAVQLADYDGADYILAPDGTAEPIRLRLAHTHAVLVHIDPENLGVSIYRVDLHIGRWGAWLADQIREWQKLDPLSPYVPPISTEPYTPQDDLTPRTPDVVVDKLGLSEPSAADLDERELIDQAVAAAGGPPQEQADSVDGIGAVFSSAHQQTFPSEAALAETHAASPPAVSASQFDTLMKLDKAALQQKLKHEHQWSDLAHDRRWLARAIVAIEGGMTDAKAVVKYAKARDDAAPAVADVTSLTEAPSSAPEPQGPSTATHLEAIAGANSVGAIEAYRKRLVELRGDQAWTDELAAAAKARVAVLNETRTTETSPGVVLDQINRAMSSSDLAQIWERVTVGNSVPEAWTAELHAAGVARLEAIKAATPPPPVNPFGE